MERVRVWLSRRALGVVLAAFVALAVTSSIVVPPFETPDEIWHFAFVQQVASGGGLPVWEPGTEMLWRQEGGQAPGYYLAAAALTFWIDQSDFRAFYDRANPFASIGFPERLNRSYLIHHPPDEWPWRGSILALHVARFFSVFLGAVTLWAIYQTLHLLVGRHKALLGTALIAFIPQFIFISGAASNDNAINATAALLLWRLVAFLKAASTPSEEAVLSPLRRPRPYLLIGLFLGLALLSKLNGISLALLAGLTLVAVAYRARSWRVLAQGGLLVTGVALLLSGWWYLRNWLLYGDLLARQMWITNTEPRPDLHWIAELRSVEFSFWGLFGWFNVAYPTWLYILFRIVALLALAGLAIEGTRWLARRRTGQEPGVAVWRVLAVGLLLAWLVGLSFSWVQFNRVMIAAQGRLFMPTAPTLALLLAVGLSAWRVRATPPVLGWAVVAGFFTLSVVTPWWIIRPAYTPSASLAALPEAATPVNIQFGDAMVLEGYTVTPTLLAPSDALDLTLYWRALGAIEEPLAVSVKAFGRGEQLLARDDSYPDAGRWPTTSWPVGSLIVDRKKLWVSGEAQTPTAAAVAVDVYRPQSLEMLPATMNEQPITALPVPLFNVVVREEGATAAPAEDFSYRPAVQEVRIDEGAVVASFAWEVGQPLGGDYHALFHLSPAPDQPPVEQGDFKPLGGDFPTSHWWPGDHLPDEASLTLPMDVPEGEYVLLLGLYDLQSGQRVAGEGGRTIWTIASLRWDSESWRSVD